jgi:WD40 repeat protein
MADVFVSYSRRDSEFVGRLSASIHDNGKEVWVDTDGIADGEVFPEAIKRAIEGSDAFVFVITPDSTHSAYCENEVEYARELQKRIVPVLRAPVPDSELHAEIRDRSWIPFTDDAQYGPSLSRLLSAIDTDLEGAREHTRWLVKALDWDKRGRNASLLLRGSELREAEAWIASRPADADPAPTPVQREYLLASRNASARRQRLLVAASLTVAVVSVGLVIFALISRSQAVTERVTADSVSLASQAESELTVDPEISVLLGIRAVHTSPTPEAMFALRESLDDSPLQLAVGIGSEKSCSASNGSGPSVAYGPGGRTLLAVRCDGRLQLVDAGTGRVERVIGLASPADVVAYSSASALFAVGTDDGLELLDPSTLDVRSILPSLGQASSVAFSPDGRAVAVGSDQGAAVWSIATHARRRLFRSTTPTTVVYSPNGRLLIAQTGLGPIDVYNLASGRLVRRLPDGTDGGVSLAVSDSTRQLAYSHFPPGGGTGIVSIMSAVSFRHPATVAAVPGDEITSLAFSPDGSQLAVGAADGTAGVWSARSHSKLLALVGHSAEVASMAFAPAGSAVATISADGTLREWRTTGTQELTIPVPAGGVIGTPAALSRRLLAPVQLAGSEAVRSWSLPDAHELGTFELPGTSGSMSPDLTLSANGRVVVLSNTFGRAPVSVWNVAERRAVLRLRPAAVSAVAPSPDGARLALSLQPTGQGHNGVNEIIGVPAGRMVKLAGRDAVCRNYNAGGYQYLAFSPDGHVIAGATFCGSVTAWNALTGQQLGHTFNEGGQIAAIAVSPDDAHVAIASWDSTATIWDARTGAARNLTGHTRGVDSIAYSPNGSRILTGSLDQTGRLWQASDGRLLRIFQEGGTAAYNTFGADGNTVLTVTNDGPLRIWQTCPDCTDPAALLALGHRSQQGIHGLTTLEAAASAGAG